MKVFFKFSKALKFAILGFALICIMATEAKSQVNVGVDYASRYVWRGFDFGNSPSIQPMVSFTSGGFEIGAWAAYATNGDPDGSEIDFYASYTLETEGGDFSLSVTNYTFPDEPGSYFSKDAHFIELGLGYSTGLTENLGLFLSGNIFVHNDDDNSIYGELGFEYEANDYTLTVFSGFSPVESATYGNSTFAFINTGFSVSKELKISDVFSVDVSSSVISNLHARKAFFVFGFGFAL
jgi:uncharacterized protein (TIGR02001 family)